MQSSHLNMLAQLFPLAVLSAATLILAQPMYGYHDNNLIADDFTPPVWNEIYPLKDEITVPTWECDVRAWARAPDLAPGGVFPVQARLAANGSACVDIVGWAVGLTMKERAVAKLK
jgi:hypothetical protein